MKTTIEISDVLFFSAENLAQQSQTTLGALIEEGLRRVLSDVQAAGTPPAFKLRDARVRGQELLLPNPRDWQALENEHLTQLLNCTTQIGTLAASKY